jgi:hypothetical protein
MAEKPRFERCASRDRTNSQMSANQQSDTLTSRDSGFGGDNDDCRPWDPGRLDG